MRKAGKSWTQKELTILYSNFKLTRKELCLLLPNRTLSAIISQCQALALSNKQTFEERFWKKVNKQSGKYGIDGKYPTECWEWIAALSGGYGCTAINKKFIHAHRVSWQLHFGKIPNKICVCHKCDNKPCIRPDHLFLGTPNDNNKDRVAKNRSWRPLGELHPFHKLTEKQVIEIRRLSKQGTRQKELAKMFQVGIPQICWIIHYKTWKHI